MRRKRTIYNHTTRAKALGSGAAFVLSALPVGPLLAQTALPPVVVEGTSRAVRSPVPAGVEAEPADQGAPGRAGRPRAAQGRGTGSAGQPAETAGGGGVPEAVPSGTASASDLVANQGTSVSVITGQQLRDTQVRTPVEALRNLPGVTVGRTGAFAGLGQVGIRGAQGRHTLVLVDGIEVNNPGDGEFDFSNLVGGEEIERIEVLRGPQSGLYGSGAIGGVVNIVTRSGKGPATLTTRAEIGSFNTRDAAAVLSGGGDKAWGLIGVATRKTDGFNISPFGTEKDGSQTTSSVFKGGFSPLQGLTIEGVLRHTGKRGNRDEENFQIPGVLIQQTDAPSRFSSDLWAGALDAKLSLLDGAWVQSLRAERRSIVNDDLSDNPAPFFDPIFERYRASAVSYRYTSTFRLDTPGVPQVRHFVTGLAETKNEGFVQYTNDGIDHERSIRSYAGEVRGEYWNSLFLSASVRRDETDTSGDFTTWRTTASLRLPGTPVRLHSSYGTGVKLPSLFELYGRAPSFFTPNPNLKPETAEGWDAGVELTFLGGAAVLDATWFNTEMKDRIKNVFAGFTATSVNQPGISTREGLEVSARLMPLPGLTIGASYTWLEAREASGIAEIRRPKDSARVDVAYAFDRNRAKVGLGVAYNGQMQDEALRTANACFFGSCFPLTPERVMLKDYWLVSATASYKLTPSMEVYARAENVLDQRYQEVYGFQTPGAAVYGGLKLTLQDKSAALVPAR
jgi:vitamin B12 transporter